MENWEITGHSGDVFKLFCRIVDHSTADIAQESSFPEKQNNYVDKINKEHNCLVHEGPNP